jgi:bilirubin oxidase
MPMMIPVMRLAIASGLLVASCAPAPPGATPPTGQNYQVQAAAPPPAGETLKTQNVLPDLDPKPGIVEVDLTASEEMIQLLPGAKTKMFVFNKTYPGPQIVCKEGDLVRVKFHNRLPQATAVHFHGMVIEPEHDGGPWNSVSPGQDHTYTWRAKKGLPMSGWFHAHPHGMTHIQVPKGMLGTIIVEDDHDPVPSSYRDNYLVLSDGKFTFDNQIPPDTEFDRFNGREGDHVFVNGQENPKMIMYPGEIRRIRVLDGGPARFYNIAAPGMKLWHVGTDGGLFGKPELILNLVMGVAERNEFLLQAPMTPGTFNFQSLPYDRGLGLREKFTRNLMTIQVTGAPKMTTPIPNTLLPVAPLNLAGAKRRFIELNAVSAGNGVRHFVMNEKRFDPIRIDNVANLGDTEIITIENKSGNWAHPMHLHSVQFQMLDNSGRPIPRWKDVFVLPRSETMSFAVKYGKDEFPGVFMFHCHILQHEDDGMMTAAFIQIGAPGYQRSDELEHPDTDLHR